jgi:hypothetical protein
MKSCLDNELNMCKLNVCQETGLSRIYKKQLKINSGTISGESGFNNVIIFQNIAVKYFLLLNS